MNWEMFQFSEWDDLVDINMKSVSFGTMMEHGAGTKKNQKKKPNKTKHKP